MPGHEVQCVHFHIGDLSFLKVGSRCKRLASKQCQFELVSSKLAQILEYTFVHYNFIFVYFPVELQRTSPSPVCPGDDVILTCTVTVSANKSKNLFLYLYDTCDQNNRVFHDVASVNSSNGSTLGHFTTQTVAVSNESIVATATIKGVTSNEAPCTGIRCVNFFGGEKVLYVALGKQKVKRTNQ